MPLAESFDGMKQSVIGKLHISCFPANTIQSHIHPLDIDYFDAGNCLLVRRLRLETADHCLPRIMA